MKFVHQRSFFYLHLDLNPVRRAGCLGSRWLNRREARNFVKEISKDSPDLIENIFENKDILDEVGLIGVFPNQDYHLPDEHLSKIDLIFLLKTKRWTDSSVLSGLKKDFHVEKLNKRIWAISSQQDICAENVATENQTSLSREKISFSGIISPPWAGGYVDFDKMIKMSEKENLFLENSPVEIKIFSSKTDPGDLSFELKSAGQKDETTDFLTQDILSKGLKEGFVFISPKDESMDDFEKKIRIGLALKRPFEESVLLPDGTRFTELKVDPDRFKFQKEEIDNAELRHWKNEFSEEQEPFEIFILESQKYFYVSNKPSLFEASGEMTDSFIQDQVIRGMYFPLNNKGIKDLTIIETPEGGKGILRLF